MEQPRSFLIAVRSADANGPCSNSSSRPLSLYRLHKYNNLASYSSSLKLCSVSLSIIFLDFSSFHKSVKIFCRAVSIKVWISSSSSGDVGDWDSLISSNSFMKNGNDVRINLFMMSEWVWVSERVSDEWVPLHCVLYHGKIDRGPLLLLLA